VERAAGLCPVGSARECDGKFRPGAQAANAAAKVAKVAAKAANAATKAAKGRHAKGLGRVAGRWRRRSRHGAREVLLQRERDAELHLRFHSVPRQRIDRKHARQRGWYFHRRTDVWPDYVNHHNSDGWNRGHIDSDCIEHHKHRVGLRSVRHDRNQRDQSGGSDQSESQQYRSRPHRGGCVGNYGYGVRADPGNPRDADYRRDTVSFQLGGVAVGTNGSQANIVAFNQLYSGSGASLCGLTNPEFIFSYASGVGPVATSPGLSVGGTEVAYVENDPNMGAILHVLTFGSGSTEYGTIASCTGNNNGGATLPTCATNPVIPGSTSGSTATDFMLPLGLVAANAATGVAGAVDSFSSPFTDYANDTTYVGDNNGYLYAITPTFNGTPAYAGNFPVHVNATAPVSDTPTQVTATTTVVTVTVPNSLSIGELVTIAGVTANGTHCSTADATAINGVQIPVTASTTQLTFDAAVPTATTGIGCTVTGATVTQGSNFLSSPVVDVGNTGDIFVGYSSSNFYEITPAGVTEATLALGVNGGTNQGMINGGIRDGAIIDSTNSVGYVVSACSPNTSAASGETDTGTAGNPGLVQFKFTSNTLTSVTITGLDSGANQSCTTAGFPLYAPTPDNRYFTLGIGSATEASNGEIIGASTGTGGQQLKPFSFVNSVLQPAPLGKPQLGNNASVMSPLTEFYNASVGVDYLFVGVNANPTELYTFALPNPLEIAQGAAPTALATNTTDVAGGTSGIIVDNDSADAQASSIYFGTLATSTTICGTTSAFCAVKLTQSALE